MKSRVVRHDCHFGRSGSIFLIVQMINRRKHGKRVFPARINNPIVRSGYALEKVSKLHCLDIVISTTYLNCKAVILASRSDMPLFTKAETAKKAPVQKGERPLLRVTSGSLASSQPPTPIMPRRRNKTM